MSIIIGSSYAKFESSPGSEDSPGTSVTAIVPLCNLSGGQVENYDVVKIQQRLININITTPSIRHKQKIFGYFIRWVFNYPDWVSGETLVNFDAILKAAKLGQPIKLTPRIDEDWRYFNVIFNSDSFGVGIRTGGIKAKYNKDFVCEFITAEMVPDKKWAVVIPLSQRLSIIGDDGFEQIKLIT